MRPASSVTAPSRAQTHPSGKFHGPLRLSSIVMSIRTRRAGNDRVQLVASDGGSTFFSRLCPVMVCPHHSVRIAPNYFSFYSQPLLEKVFALTFTIAGLGIVLSCFN